MTDDLGRSRRRWNGWGGEGTDFPLKPKAVAFLADRLGAGNRLADATLAEVIASVPTSRLPPHPLVATDPETRIRNARGHSFPDWLALRSGRFGRFPDGVARPTTGAEVGDVLRWAHLAGFTVIVRGGGTSVAGHVDIPPSPAPVLVLSLERLDRLMHLDPDSRLATFGAGATGPAIERQLAERGFTLGHFPQSWELSTVGGWIAARSSGQQSRRYGRIEQLFAGGRLETPRGTLRLPTFPASAAGPDLREMVLGSEGRLGALTEVDLRITPRPEHESFHVAFLPTRAAGIALLHRLIDREIPLSMMRLSDPRETVAHLALGGDHRLFAVFDRAVSALGARPGDRAMFTFGVTGPKRPARRALAETLSAIRRLGGVTLAHGAMGRIWEHSRFRSPYFRNGLWEHGYSVDTVETAVDWSRVETTMTAVETAIATAAAGAPLLVFSHLSHVYAQGCSVYTTYVFPNAADYDTLAARWRAMKRAASDAIVASGGTISHQHGVGRDHAPWLVHEKGERGLAAIRAVVDAFDPEHRLNPGCLLED